MTGMLVAGLGNVFLGDDGNLVSGDAAGRRAVASRIAAKDATLWGPRAQEEAAKRLGWVDLHRTSRALIGSRPRCFLSWRAYG